MSNLNISSIIVILLCISCTSSYKQPKSNQIVRAASAVQTQVILVPGTGNTWTDGIDIWAGNQYCKSSGMLLQGGSPAIDKGDIIPGIHCPVAGPGDGTCQEWYGLAPDIGACEYVGGSVQPPPTPSWTFCANEHEQCNFTGTRTVRYGDDSGSYVSGQYTNGVFCDNSIFGDPDFGVGKHCDIGTLTPNSVNNLSVH